MCSAGNISVITCIIDGYVEGIKVCSIEVSSPVLVLDKCVIFRQC